MASLEEPLRTGEISPRFDKFLKDVVDHLSPEELEYAVSSIRTNFEIGKFGDKGDQDLYSCLHLFANQGLVSEDNLTLLEKFVVTPQTSKKKEIEEQIEAFKAIRLQEFKESKAATSRELTGRHSDLKNVMSKLTTGGSSVVNLYGASGVGKTRLANEVLYKWQGTQTNKFNVDLREIDKMEDVHFHLLQVLSTESEETTVSYEANPVILKMMQLRQREQGNILLLFDNVDQFSGGKDEAAVRRNTNFVSFLQRLTSDKTGGEKSSLKILLTSRSAFRHGVENYEVRGLERVSSWELLQRQGTPAIQGGQRERLVEICRGKPLLLNGMASILRQETDAERLLGTIEQELAVEQSQDTGKEQTEKEDMFDVNDEGIDEEQLSCLRKMFFFLPSKTLKESAVSVSLFCRPFSLEAAAEILGVNVSEAAIRMEAMRNSQVVFLVPESKELLYDIHPLMRKFLKSIGNSKAFVEAYQKAEDNFCKHFVPQLITIAALLDKDYVKAFDSFDFQKPNFELALDISMKSNYLLISQKHRESVLVCYLFEAMISDQGRRRKIFHTWAEKIEDDGKEGSIFRAELQCWEALQVLTLEGWRRAAEVVQESRELLKRVQRDGKKTKLFKIAKSSCLFVEGEVFSRAGNWPKALKSLRRSLEIMEEQLNNHTSTCRCLNAIGNCYNSLGNPEQAIKFYTRAYEMRQKLSGSREHFDLPLFRSQIGTVYESMAIQEYLKNRTMTPQAEKKFRKAIGYYQEALDLAKELKLTGILYTALYNRNIANAYSWLMEYEKAKPFAYNGYQIRKDILGKHPLTARSTFQMAENSRGLGDYDKAKEYYEEAWEIEKSLGQGNHSEVRDRLIKGYEGMLHGERKRAFQKEVLEFYQRSWDEVKRFEGFQFSQANMVIIDSIEERLKEEADEKTRRKYENEALWFYEGAWNSPDNKRLLYEQREHILQTLLRLCQEADNKELFEKYRKESFRFYEKRWKKTSSELEKQAKIDFLTALEDLATSLGCEKKTKKYNTLLKETNRGASFSWRFLNPFVRAEKSPDNDDDDDDDYDSSNDDDDSVDDDFNENDDSGSNDDGDDGGAMIIEEHELLQQIHELSLEGQVEGVDESDLDKVKIHEGTLTSEGTHWPLKRGGAHIFFLPNAVSEPTPIVVHRWKCSARSPPLQEHEVVVSNVLEISTITGHVLEFDAEAKLVLSHSAPCLQGYELVIKKLIDQESNEWEEVDGTEDLRCWQDIEDDFPSHHDTSDVSFPIAQADITECSTYAVVCRLKSSPTYTITSSGGSFSHPDYPGVNIEVPKKAVPPKGKFALEFKVQEVPSEEFEGQDLFLSPILRIICNQFDEFLKPVTIQLPVCLRSDQKETPDPSTCRGRVLFFNSDGEDKKSMKITDDLRSPVNFDGKFVSFQVERFSRYACGFVWSKADFSFSGLISYMSSLIWTPPIPAVFFAYFEKQDRAHLQDVLHLICCPAHLREVIIQRLDKRNVVLREGYSRKKMIPGRDKAFVFVSGGISALDEENVDDFHLKFESDLCYSCHLRVRLISDQVLSHVEFRSSPDPTARNLLSRLNFRLSSLKVERTKTPVEFFGVPLDDAHLLDADVGYVLAACRGFVSDELYQGHFTRFTSENQAPTQVLKSFFENLAELDSEHQDSCFEAIVRVLKEMSAEGSLHVVKRLLEAREKVIVPLGEETEVIKRVSQKVGSSWKKLARELELKEGTINNISEDEKESDDEERCYVTLQTWCQQKGKDATVRKLMIALTRIGKAEVNNDIMECLDLLNPENTRYEASSVFAREPLRVTLLGDEWGSSKGGLSTLNRELSKHLARQPDVEITVLLLSYDEKEKREAHEFNVRLATPEVVATSDRIMELCFPSGDLNIDVVIGYGQKLGVPAQVIAEQRKCKRVHIVHTASEELAMLKEGKTALPKGEEKHQAELELCKKAEIVVAIGPKLAEAISAPLRSFRKDQHLIDITPGIFPEFAKLEQASEEGERFRILVFGRGDSEDFKLKGYDIAAKAVAGLNDKIYLLIFVGAPKGKEEEVKNRLLECGIPSSQLIVRGFVESRDTLKRFFCEADLAAMPSRTEGFSLTVLEALSAGLPILVSDNSGLGKAIKTISFDGHFWLILTMPKNGAKLLVV